MARPSSSKCSDSLPPPHPSSRELIAPITAGRSASRLETAPSSLRLKFSSSLASITNHTRRGKPSSSADRDITAPSSSNIASSPRKPNPSYSPSSTKNHTRRVKASSSADTDRIAPIAPIAPITASLSQKAKSSASFPSITLKTTSTKTPPTTSKEDEMGQVLGTAKRVCQTIRGTVRILANHIGRGNVNGGAAVPAAPVPDATTPLLGPSVPAGNAPNGGPIIRAGNRGWLLPLERETDFELHVVDRRAINDIVGSSVAELLHQAEAEIVKAGGKAGMKILLLKMIFFKMPAGTKMPFVVGGPLSGRVAVVELEEPGHYTAGWNIA